MKSIPGLSPAFARRYVGAISTGMGSSSQGSSSLLKAAPFGTFGDCASWIFTPPNPAPRLARPGDLTKRKTEMTNANEAYRKAANSPAARQAAETAKSIGEEVTDFANDVSRKAGKQFDRAQDMAVDAMQDAGDAMRRYPLSTLAIVAGLGFLFGVFSVSRR
jgi:ElaB/YqjD/DUF883 family membrane-anchored ribosome-binding protein